MKLLYTLLFFLFLLPCTIDALSAHYAMPNGSGSLDTLASPISLLRGNALLSSVDILYLSSGTDNIDNPLVGPLPDNITLEGGFDSNVLAAISPIGYDPCPYILPNYSQDFSSYLPECWQEGNDGEPSNGPDDLLNSSWDSDIFGNKGSTTSARINIEGMNNKDWLISPAFELSIYNLQVDFFVALTEEGDSSSTVLGTDDTIHFVITNDFGVNWETLQTWNSDSTISSMGDYYFFDLTEYYQDSVMFGFYATNGTTNDVVNNDFFMNRFQVRTHPYCFAPYGLCANNITFTQAELCWSDDNNSTDWEIVIGQSGFNPYFEGTTITTSDNPYLWTSGSEASTYDFYVRSKCAIEDGGTSQFGFSYSFSTPCNIIPPDYLEGFDDYNAYSLPPDCWMEGNGGTPTSGPTDSLSSAWSPGYFANGNSKSASISIHNTSAITQEWLISPQFDLGTIDNPYQMDVDVALVDAVTSNSANLGSDDTIHLVLISEIIGNQILDTWTADSLISITGDHVQIDLEDYSGPVRFGFYVTSGNIVDHNTIFFIDDFRVGEPPVCSPPSSLKTTYIGINDATLEWVENGTANLWNIEIDTSGFTPSGIPTDSGINYNSFYWNEGVENTTYDYYVQSDCGMYKGGPSTWVGPYTFTTRCNLIIPDYYQDFTDYEPDCWLANSTNEDLAFINLSSSHWKEDGFGNNGTTGALKIQVQDTTGIDILYSPFFDLSTGGPYQLTFDIALTQANNTNGTTLGSDDTLYLAVFSNAQMNSSILGQWNSSTPIPPTGDRVSVDLSNYLNDTIIVFIAASGGSIFDPQNNDLFIDNFLLQECQSIIPEYSEDFSSDFPDCWLEGSGGTVTEGPSNFSLSNWSMDGFANNGESGAVKIQIQDTTTKDWLISPVFDLTQGESFQLSFDLALTQFDNTTNSAFGTDDSLYLVAVTIGNEEAELRTLRAWSSNTPISALGESITISLDNVSGSTIRLAFFATSGSVLDGVNNDLFIDNLLVKECPPIIPDYQEDFSTFFPDCWLEGREGAPNMGPSIFANSNWIADGFANIGNSGAAKIQIQDTTTRDWLISPLIDISMGGPYLLSFDMALTQSNNTLGSILGSDDSLYLLIAVFGEENTVVTPLNIWDSSTPISSTLEQFSVYLDYRSLVRIAFYATSGSTKDIENNDIFIDNFSIRNCGPIVPEYSENFSKHLPDCWIDAEGGNVLNGPDSLYTSQWSEDGFANVGTTGATRIQITDTTTRDWLVSPRFDLTMGGPYQINYNMALTQSGVTSSTTLGSDDSIQLLLVKGNSQPPNIIVLETWDNSTIISSTGEQVTIDLDDYSQDTIQLAFFASSGSTVDHVNNDFFIDDFIIQEGDLNNCSQDSLMLGVGILPSGTYSGILTLSSGNTIENPSAVEFVASKGINLDAGFLVEKGVEFFANIALCSNPSGSEGSTLLIYDKAPNKEETILKKSISQEEERTIYRYWASHFASKKENKKALSNLHKAVAKGYDDLLSLKIDKRLNLLRAEEEFSQILKKLGDNP